MSSKRKLHLKDLHIDSFVTSQNQSNTETLRGGALPSWVLDCKSKKVFCSKRGVCKRIVDVVKTVVTNNTLCDTGDCCTVG